MQPVPVAARATSTYACLGLWRWFRRLPGPAQLLLAALLLAALFAGFFAEENWRGRRAWETCRHSLVAKGVELDWSKFIPPPVPDDQNFATTPFLAPLFDFNPLPLQPGQTPWRDVAGHTRAVEFAASLLTPNRFGAITSAMFDGHLLDLADAAQVLLGETNTALPTVLTNRSAAAVALLEAMAQFAPVLDELHAASRRPYARFNIQYNAEDPISILLPHLMVLERVGRVLELRACAELALNQTDAALADLKLMVFLGQSVSAEPFLVCLRARQYLLTEVDQVVWEGLAEQRWSDPQLQAVEAELSRVKLFAGLSHALQAERAVFGDRLFGLIRNHKNVLRDWLAADNSAGPLAYLLAGPQGWFYQEQAVSQRLYQDRVLAGFDPSSGHLSPHVIEQHRFALSNDLSGSCLWRHTAIAKTVLDQEMKLFQNTAFAQARLDLAATACALERFRLTHRGYPQNLDALVPRFAAGLSQDVCTGLPLKYRLTTKDKFMLYEVGWDETDDGGTAAPDTSDGLVPKAGDWLWPAYPESSPEPVAKINPVPKSEGRHPKSERNPKPVTRIACKRPSFPISDFGLLSDFGFRISDFCNGL